VFLADAGDFYGILVYLGDVDELMLVYMQSTEVGRLFTETVTEVVEGPSLAKQAFNFFELDKFYFVGAATSFPVTENVYGQEHGFIGALDVADLCSHDSSSLVDYPVTAVDTALVDLLTEVLAFAADLAAYSTGKISSKPIYLQDFCHRPCQRRALRSQL